MQSLASALRRPDGDRRGGASLRLGLVTALVVAQSMEVSESAPLLAALKLWWVPSLCFAGLGATLGFAAARHRAGSSWREVAGDRLRLAVPVYAFAVVAAALVLGVALTDEGRTSYLRDGRTYLYLLNLVGVPQFELPGVFDFTNIPRVVNAVVWVAPVYAVMLAVACLPPRGRMLRLVPAVLAAAVAVAALLVQSLDPDWAAASDLAALAFRGDGLSAVLGGLIGMALFHARDRVPATTLAAGAAGAVLVGAAVAANPGWLGTAPFRIVLAMPGAYLAVFLACRRLSWGVLSSRIEPYLPGLLLFAYPLQQAAVERGPERQEFLVNLALAAPAALILAIAFWHVAGRRLLTPSMMTALADTDPARRQPLIDFGRARRMRRGAVTESLAIMLVLGGLFIGIMALVYIAMLPE